MTDRRIYLVRHESKPIALVRASNQAQAIRLVVRDTYSAGVATQDELVRHLPDMPVQVAGTDEVTE